MTDPLIAPDALRALLAGAPGRANIKLLDATWFMPGSGREAYAEYLQAHLPGAAYFDIDAVADRESPLPHMLPSPQAFAEAVGRLGVGARDHVVVYDRAPIPSAARVWWTFRTMGHDAVQVLDGGLEAWRTSGGELEHAPVHPTPATYLARLRPELVRDFATVLAALEDRSVQMVDARPAARFRGEAAEPRVGLRSGHAPGALNTPSSSFYAVDGRLLDAGALGELFRRAGVDVDRPVVASCGSGVTAGVVALALARLGRWDTPVYDGSWADWGARSEAPVVAGP